MPMIRTEISDHIAVITMDSPPVNAVNQQFMEELIAAVGNANPDSVRAALDVLADLPGPRLLVLGDMGEVGEQGPVFHAEAGALARSLGIEQVFTLGVLSRATSQSFGGGQHFDNLDALQAAVMTALPHCASVLVKGARFMQMERVVQAITAPATSTLKETHAV